MLYIQLLILLCIFGKDYILQLKITKIQYSTNFDSLYCGPNKVLCCHISLLGLSKSSCLFCLQSCTYTAHPVHLPFL